MPPIAVAVSRRRAEGKKCGVGCPRLNSFLRGGIPCGSVTEVVGESGAGKTLLSLQLLLAVQAPFSEGGLQGRALYIYTEGRFPSQRLFGLASLRRERGVGEVCSRCRNGSGSAAVYGSLGDGRRALGVINSEHHAQEEQFSGISIVRKAQTTPSGINGHLQCVQGRHMCENILVKEVHTIDDLLMLLDTQTIQLLNHKFVMPVKLVVIDSVASLFRADFENGKADLVKRAGLFFRLAARLKQFAQQLNIAVLVTNQVVDCFQKDEEQSGNLEEQNSHLITSDRVVRPALGLSWSSCVNSRLFLSKTSGNQRQSLGDDPDMDEKLSSNECGQEVLATRRLQVQAFSKRRPPFSHVSSRALTPDENSKAEGLCLWILPFLGSTLFPCDNRTSLWTGIAGGLCSTLETRECLIPFSL